LGRFVEQMRHDRPSRSSVPLQSSRTLPPPVRPFAKRAPSRRSHPVSEPAGLPLLGFLLPERLDVGCAFSTRSPSRSLVTDEDCHGLVGCRPQGSCPSRRFSLARGSHRTFWVPVFTVTPDASQPSFMPLAPLELPFRAFPSRGAVPALAGLCFRPGSRSTTAGAMRARPSRPFHPRRQLLALEGPLESGHWDA